VLSECILWSLVAALFVVPVILRFFAGDDTPRNEITQEQDGSSRPERDADDDGLLLAA
jgi:D-aminopeptidase